MKCHHFASQNIQTAGNKNRLSAGKRQRALPGHQEQIPTFAA
jgi:hypothetical protein